MTVILGVDSSVAETGGAMWTPGVPPVTFTWKSDPKRVMQDRWRQIMAPVWSCVGGRKRTEVLVLIEKPNPASKGGAAILLNHGLYAVLTYSWHITGITFVPIVPTQLKKFATGKGNASKEDVLLAVERRYGHLVTIKNNNEADAFTLMAMGCWQYNEALVKLPANHIDHLDKIAWPEWSTTG